jgi:hypothetical protein
MVIIKIIKISKYLNEIIHLPEITNNTQKMPLL